MSYFWSCDWGSSSFRLRLVSVSDLTILAEKKSSKGISTLTQAPLDMELDFAAVLHEAMDEILGKHGLSSFGPSPCVLSGMVSSAHGWCPLPYAKLPFHLDGSSLVYEKKASLHPAVDAYYILAGVSSEDDIMRGEEIEMIGLFQSKENAMNQDRCMLVLPGTHSKHLLIQNGQLVDIRTYMTGELYELLISHSVLRLTVSRESQQDPGCKQWFNLGVKRSVNSGLLNSLFTVRTNGVFEVNNKNENAYYLSGLLIGKELSELAQRHAQRHDFERIVVYADKGVATLYEWGCHSLGLEKKLILLSSSDELPSVLGHNVFLNHLKKSE